MDIDSTTLERALQQNTVLKEENRTLKHRIQDLEAEIYALKGDSPECDCMDYNGCKI